jgi:NADH-quinone oxidoreductase subunit H
VANVVLLMLVIVMTTAAALSVAERKWSALIQNRIGPNRIRVFGNPLGGCRSSWRMR